MRKNDDLIVVLTVPHVVCGIYDWAEKATGKAPRTSGAGDAPRRDCDTRALFAAQQIHRALIAANIDTSILVTNQFRMMTDENRYDPMDRIPDNPLDTKGASLVADRRSGDQAAPRAPLRDPFGYPLVPARRFRSDTSDGRAADRFPDYEDDSVGLFLDRLRLHGSQPEMPERDVHRRPPDQQLSDRILRGRDPFHERRADRLRPDSGRIHQRLLPKQGQSPVRQNDQKAAILAAESEVAGDIIRYRPIPASPPVNACATCVSCVPCATCASCGPCVFGGADPPSPEGWNSRTAIRSDARSRSWPGCRQAHRPTCP
jgi:hypothetical protein